MSVVSFDAHSEQKTTTEYLYTQCKATRKKNYIQEKNLNYPSSMLLFCVSFYFPSYTPLTRLISHHKVRKSGNWSANSKWKCCLSQIFFACLVIFFACLVDPDDTLFCVFTHVSFNRLLDCCKIRIVGFEWDQTEWQHRYCGLVCVFSLDFGVCEIIELQTSKETWNAV